MCCCAMGTERKKYEKDEEEGTAKHTETLSHRRRRRHQHLHFLISLVFGPALGQQMKRQQEMPRFRQ